MKFFTRFSPPEKKGIEFTDPSMTEQHFKLECDINYIVNQYQTTGVMPQGDRQPLFGDFAEFPTDLQSSMAMYDEAHDRFMQLDANVRKFFGNDPAKLLAFLHDEKNRDQAIELGLIERPAPVKNPVSPERTNVVTPPSGGAEN